MRHLCQLAVLLLFMSCAPAVFGADDNDGDEKHVSAPRGVAVEKRSVLPDFYRGLQLLVIPMGGVAFGVLGFCLYAIGVTRGEARFESLHPILRFVLSGQGPGILFMGLGALVVMLCIPQGENPQYQIFGDEPTRMEASIMGALILTALVLPLLSVCVLVKHVLSSKRPPPRERQ